MTEPQTDSRTPGEPPRGLLVGLCALMLAGILIVHLWLDVSLGVTLLIFLVGWPVVGTVITLDDDLPGGWSKPDGSVRPPWLQPPFWGMVTAGLGASAVGFAIDAGWRSAEARPYWIAAVAAGFLAGALLTRRRSR
jgi:hypothetical protein